MSDAERAGQIRLSVDQEVFIESVANGDLVEDANVATEVTSFERVGEAYVLEGAIVFAGFLAKSRESQENAVVDSESGAANYGKHVHHRMPFMLRVPVAYQPRGVVNVASRISDWQLDVLGDSWLRVQADLSVIGLNGKHGFHFQCGAQEEGDVFFNARGSDSSGSSAEHEGDGKSSTQSPEFAAYESNSSEAQGPVEEPVSLVRGDDSAWRTAPGDDAPHKPEDAVERLSLARGGVVDSELDEVEQEIETRTDTEVKPQKSAREELADLDRFVNTQASVDEAETPETHGPTDANEPAVEFEFEHQVDVSKLQPVPTARTDDSHTEEYRRAEGQEVSFVPSRSFSEEGFQATAGFVPEIVLGSSVTPEEDSFEDTENTERGLVDTSLWSFVDFNAPDSSFTLRYLVVMDEESIVTLAERAGCSESELLSANHLRGDSLIPGQVLRVPEPSHRFR